MKADRILLFYTGSPESPDPAHVAAYLREFLMDPYMLSMPRALRYLLVHGVIVPLRASKSAARYQQIWMPEGSPLAVYTRRLRDALQELLPECAVEAAAAYGPESLRAYLERMEAPAVKRLIVFPLFPHHAEATHGMLRDVLADFRRAYAASGPDVRVVPPFYATGAYLDAMRESAAPRLDAFKADHVLFTYHGLPIRQARIVSDPGLPDYESQCEQTTALLVERLGLQPGRYSHAYQSRFGRGWLGPSTESTLAELARAGQKRVALVAPSFVGDCLETLEELDTGAREVFLAAGGEAFLRIPALNADPAWVHGAARILQEELNRG